MTNPSSASDSDRVARLEQELSHLSKALKRTERSLGGFQWALALLVIGGVAAAILVRNGVIDLKRVLNLPAVMDTVESKEFGLYNRDGKRVMIGDYDKFGHPSLAFLDLDLNYRLAIWFYNDVKPGAPGIAFFDKTGTRALFRLGKEGDALFQLMGQEKKGGMVLKVAQDGTPSLTMTDASGKVLFQAPEGSAPAAPAQESSRRPGAH